MELNVGGVACCAPPPGMAEEERPMMVIMKPGHTREQFEDVMNRIREVGLDGHPIVGVERTVIGVVGMDRPYPELADEIGRAHV